MSRIFLSHSSIDELEAVALNTWLDTNGWKDVFLDLDPQRGLQAGERWQQALRRAADRCEAVVFIITPAWAKSDWCRTEFLLAKSLNKRIFGVIVADVAISELRVELTSEWQLCRLVGDGPKETITFEHKGQARQWAFLAEGLKRLHRGLINAGIDARHFRWPPDDDPQRPPYRGLAPLDEKDAAIYFGRDAQIVRGLDALRGMRSTRVESLFVILGPSGCGKSSFLRAGLIPRLKRDDRHFLPLPIVRPERRAITGEYGLANALHQVCLSFGLTDQTLGGIKAQLAQGAAPLTKMLLDIQQKACERLRVEQEDIIPPTLLLSIDQAEELFAPGASDEAHRFLTMIGDVLRDADKHHLLMIVAFTIRSDRYEPLQTAIELAGLKNVVFDDLKPMPTQQFKEVIEGPARRTSEEGKRLKLEPALVERLLADCAQGADTLPLLSLTLARLYREYGSDGDLRVSEYEAMGGLACVVNTEVDTIFAEDAYERNTQLAALHDAFIPWLAAINPKNSEPMRRIARYADLPVASHKLIDALADKRLLIIDRRGGEKVVEVAHEALFRVWETLAGWLRQDGRALIRLKRIEDAADVWASESKATSRLWSEERIIDALKEIERSSLSIDNVDVPALVHSFLGPVSPAVLIELLELGESDNAAKGSGPYGEFWRLPLSHEARASIGVRLALLGDQRPGVGLRADGLPDIEWRRIEGGVVKIAVRSDPHDIHSPVSESIETSVKSFNMARYPITVCQFQAFLRECYIDGKWHLPVGLPPDLLSQFPPIKHRARHGNYPADSVNWFDATVFCHWLAQRLDLPIRLPTEFEWQLAANGGDVKRLFPWGSEWNPQLEPWRANTSESGLGGTTAAGLYTAGASPAGILDLAGTTHEWCSNSYENPRATNIAISDKSRRVLRGGSWYASKDYAQCGNRDSEYPGDRRDGIGFRVVRSLTRLNGR